MKRKRSELTVEFKRAAVALMASAGTAQAHGHTACRDERLGGRAAADRRVGASARPAAAGTRFFQASLAASRGVAAAEAKAWRNGVYALVQAMTQQQGSLTVERMCALAQVSRAGYYRHWQAAAPRSAETALRDEVQRLALAQRHYGYRRITALLRRVGWRVNHKRVMRLMREDNLLCLRKA